MSQIARTIAKALRLNESLAEAIALGIRSGAYAFGHSGEAVLNKICEDGFTHYEQSVRVVEKLEKMERIKPYLGSGMGSAITAQQVIPLP